jgi:hypothetical protein
MGVNHPSVESSDLNTARKIVPHATSSKGEKAGRVCDQGGRRKGRKRKEEKNSGKYRVSDSREEGE